MSIEFKSNKMIEEDKLDRNEAKHFIAFLEAEKWRHILAMRMCDSLRYEFRHVPVLQQAYNSSLLRHLEDIQFTQKTIDKLTKKYNLSTEELMGS
jgi:hypothetical protein